MTRWSALVAVALTAAAPLRAAAATLVTWEVDGTLTVMHETVNEEGVPKPFDPVALNSLGVFPGAHGTASFTMTSDALLSGLPGQIRYEGAVASCGLSVGSVHAICGSVSGSAAQVDPPGRIFVGGRSGIVGFVYLDLRLEDGAPLPGPGFPFPLPAESDLASYVPGEGPLFVLQDAGGILGYFEFELTAIRQVPEPDLTLLGVGLAAALLRWRRATSG